MKYFDDCYLGHQYKVNYGGVKFVLACSYVILQVFNIHGVLLLKNDILDSRFFNLLMFVIVVSLVDYDDEDEDEEEDDNDGEDFQEVEFVFLDAGNIESTPSLHIDPAPHVDIVPAPRVDIDPAPEGMILHDLL